MIFGTVNIQYIMNCITKELSGIFKLKPNILSGICMWKKRDVTVGLWTSFTLLCYCSISMTFPSSIWSTYVLHPGSGLY